MLFQDVDEGAIGWDLQSVRPVIPWEERLFILYTLVVLVFAMVRFIGLAQQLGWLPMGKWKRREIGDQGSASVLAHSALRGQLQPIRNSSGKDTRDLHSSLSEQFLQSADSRYRYLWELCCVKTQAMRKVTVATALLAAFVLVADLSRLLLKVAEQKGAVFLGIFSGGASEATAILAWGIFVFTALYSVQASAEVALQQRKAAWNFFRESNRDLGTENSPSAAAHA